MNEIEKATVRAIVNVFETGRVRGDYSALAVLKGDTGHLSYGRSQTTLGSGNLYRLLNSYCQQPAAQFATELGAVLPRFRQKDFTLDTDSGVKDLLRKAGSDPVMRAAQDQFFNQEYLLPALRAAEGIGISEPLGHAVVYDSHIQGGWATLSGRMPRMAGVGPREWIGRYIDERTKWLQSLRSPLPSTVYRMDTFRTLAQTGNWTLALPIVVHGVSITQDDLGDDVMGAPPRTLRLTKPYLRGPDVEALQKALKNKGLIDSVDGVYGPFTDTIVKNWQAQNNIAESGAGPETRRSLGL